MCTHFFFGAGIFFSSKFVAQVTLGHIIYLKLTIVTSQVFFLPLLKHFSQVGGADFPSTSATALQKW